MTCKIFNIMCDNNEEQWHQHQHQHPQKFNPKHLYVGVGIILIIQTILVL